MLHDIVITHCTSEYYWFYTIECQSFHTHWVKMFVVLKSAWHRHGDFPLFMCFMYMSWLLRYWSHLHLSPQTLVYCPEMVLLTTCVACLTKCQVFSLHMCCTTVVTIFFIFNPLFCSLGCCLSTVFVCLYFCTWSKSLMLSISSSTFFFTIFTSTLWAHINNCSLSISLVCLGHQFFYNFLHNFFIIYTINKLFLELSIMFYGIPFCCFLHGVYPSNTVWIHSFYCVIYSTVMIVLIHYAVVCMFLWNIEQLCCTFIMPLFQC